MKSSAPFPRRKIAAKAKPTSRADSYTLSRAKTYLGRLLEKAQNGQTVYILRGRSRFILQPVPEIEPIPMRPPGYFASCYSKADAKLENKLGSASVVKAPEDLE